MPNITYLESQRTWIRWMAATGDDSDESHHLMRIFIGIDDTDPVYADAGYIVTDHQYTRAKMLLGPHYQTIIRMWLLRRENDAKHGS